MKLAAITITMLLMAGCLGGKEEPVDTASAPEGDKTAPVDPSASASAPSSSSSSSAGSPTPASSSASAPAAASADAAAPVPVETVLPYSWSSKLTAEACVPVAILGCAGAIAREGWFDQPAFAGRPTHAKLDLTWTTETGGASEMRFALARAKSCEGDGCWTSEPIVEIVGASPLAIDADIPALAADEWLVVVARAASMFPDPLYGYAHTEQSFSTEGSFTVLS